MNTGSSRAPSRTDTSPRRVWAALVATLLLLGVVALGARQLPGSSSVRDPIVIEFDLLQAITNFFLTIGAIGALVAAYLMLPRKDDTPVRVRRSYLRGVLVLLVTLALALAVASLFEGRNRAETPAATSSVTETVEGGERGESPQWGALIMVGAVVLGILAVGGGLVRLRSVPGVVPAPADSRIEAFLGIPEELPTGSDPRSRVVRAYAGMVGELARHELPRRPADTPNEYLSRAAGRLGDARPAARHLTRLFEEARFSHHEVDDRMAGEAEAAFQTVRAKQAGL